MAKARLYKMVNSGVMKKSGITVKVGDKVVTQPTINFTKNISAINSMGATVNSIAVLTEELKESFQTYSLKSISNMQGLLDQRKDHLDNEKKLRKSVAKEEKVEKGKQADKLSEKKQETTTVKKSVPVIKQVAKAAFGFLEGIAKLFAGLFTKFIGYSVFKWMSSPNAVKKLSSLIKGIGHMVKFFAKVAGFIFSFGLDGLTDFFANPNIFSKIFGLGKFMVALGLFFKPVMMAKLGLAGAKGVLTLFKSGKLITGLKGLFTGIGGLIKGLMALVSGIGLGPLLLGGAAIVGGAMVLNQIKDVEKEDLTEVKEDDTAATGFMKQGGLAGFLNRNVLGGGEEKEEEKPALAKGGWIQGPMSGYPVSLDGGKSTSFIGHGTEYVATPEMAVGGGPLGQAFVVPYDTPATRTSPGLTNTRLLQAKSAGFNVAPMSAGGLLESIGNVISAPQIPYNEIESKIGADKKTWDIFRDTIAGIESSGKYKVYGGNNDMYDGRYQMGKLAKMDGARIMNQKDPGHSDDPNKFMRVMFRNNKTMQERLFAGYTIANHNYLSSVKEYAEADALRKLQILAYAHNQGWQGAKTYVKEGTVGSDSFGTKGTDYTNAIKAAFESNNLTPQIKEVSSVQNTVKNIISKTQQIAQNIMSGDSINESSLKDVESNESSFQVVAGDLGPIDLSTEPINPPPIITGGGSPYVIPANAYVKPRFGLLADVASTPVEIS
tara:strand:- start:19423 stop:21576 length:2154 start_codon:yes stop_codon:yes gene_type:complete